jgi:outer membrane protein insertion porin family
VSFDIPRPDQLQKEQNVPIRLTEARPYTISYGLGYQSFDKLRGIFGISNRNLFGTARSLGLQMRGGFREARALLSYIDPHLLFHDVTNTVSAFAERGQRKSFDFRRIGATLQVEKKLSDQNPYLQRQFGPSTSVFLRYDFEDIRTTGGLTPSLDPIDREFLAIHISSVSPSFVRDARDNSIDPTQGTYLSTEFQWATKIIGSGTNFVKWFNQAQYYHAAYKTIVATSLRLGLARAFDSTNELPLSQRFFAGGGRSIRGFELDTAGPLDPVTGKPLGGNSLFILNLEDRFPIYGNLGGVLFFDYGNVFEFLSGPTGFSFGGLRKTSGIGLRYKTPIGPLTIDWGYKLDRRDGESPSEFFVSVGHAF